MELTGTLKLGTKIKDQIFKAFSVVFLVGLFIIVLDSDLRSNVRSMIRPDYRVILAVAGASLDGTDAKYQILKVKTGDGLFLEVYGKEKDQTAPTLVASTKLPDKKDGYFTFNGEVTNLAVDDIDGDKKPEILATTFDGDLVAHLNVYRFNKGERELELVHLK